MSVTCFFENPWWQAICSEDRRQWSRLHFDLKTASRPPQSTILSILVVLFAFAAARMRYLLVLMPSAYFFTLPLIFAFPAWNGYLHSVLPSSKPTAIAVGFISSCSALSHHMSLIRLLPLFRTIFLKPMSDTFKFSFDTLCNFASYA